MKATFYFLVSLCLQVKNVSILRKSGFKLFLYPFIHDMYYACKRFSITTYYFFGEIKLLILYKHFFEKASNSFDKQSYRTADYACGQNMNYLYTGQRDKNI